MASIEGARRGALFTRWICAFALVLASVFASANAQAVRLVPVITAGLSSPLYVTSARDGSNRLFIVELVGSIRVAQPGATSSTLFLDITASVLAGGERGLLGLAFHPAYASNGRLFVYYTRAADGAIEIAEYRRSANPDVADSAGRVLLTIAHPGFANHNGGMVAFGPDGYLYLGVGDGGSGNDPSNNAQNLESLLGKILRIDVDTAPARAAGSAYSVPPDNPFVNRAGRDEIFAYGFRNPFRFSFDRSTGQLWVGDVGQNAREEVDTPIVRGGNYGWRVYEGASCTNNDLSLCNPANFLAPLFDYPQTMGHCSTIGGYVYRGTRGALAQGTYVYGDFCTGEIFAWNGSTQALLLDTTTSLASFGEDERGELYVVDIGGAVHKLASESVIAASIAIEYFHQSFGHYFTTSIADEIEKLDRGILEGWQRTGESFNVSSPGSAGLANVCRFFSATSASKSSHFYTPFAAECESVKRNPSWQFEGEVYAFALPDALGNCADAMQPLYRVYNNGRGGAPNHRYTTRFEIRSTMLAQGWIAEGLGTGVIGCVPAFR